MTEALLKLSKKIKIKTDKLERGQGCQHTVTKRMGRDECDTDGARDAETDFALLLCLLLFC